MYQTHKKVYSMTSVAQWFLGVWIGLNQFELRSVKHSFGDLWGFQEGLVGLYHPELMPHSIPGHGFGLFTGQAPYALLCFSGELSV